MTDEKRTLAVGDTHGHADRLEALLRQEKVIDDTGRINHDVRIVMLGDIAHNGVEGSKERDFLCWQLLDQWLEGDDTILWGNHDRAVIDLEHSHGGYEHPLPETLHLMQTLRAEGRIKLATASHGFLLTHAGLHASFKHRHIPTPIKTNVIECVNWLNELDKEFLPQYASYGNEFCRIRDDISYERGGRANAGGILWRDASESLYTGFRQIFGHSAKDRVRRYTSPKNSAAQGDSYCVDVGQKDNGRLAAIMLPEEKIVEVNLNE
jgi:hypothetical protein